MTPPSPSHRAVIYARVSSDKSDKSSCDQQLRECREFAKARGMVVVHEYRDDFITGTDDSRPGYLAMLSAAEDGQFDCIIAHDSDRLTRSPGELPRLIDALQFSDQFILTTDGRLDSRDENAGILAGLYGGMGAVDLKKHRHRVQRGQRQRFEEGNNTGGKLYGYRSVRLDPTSEDDRRARREIEPTRAAIVKRIFKEYADGSSPRMIAVRLNDDGIAAPGADWDRKVRRKDAKWQQTAVRTMLDNDLYSGRLIFNKHEWRKVPGTRRRSCRVRPESEWMRREHPELRIIDEEVWQAVRDRRAALKERSRPIDCEIKQKRSDGTEAIKKVRSVAGYRHEYVLSGILKCAECAASLVIVDSKRYGCGTHRNGGDSACTHDRRYYRDFAEHVVLGTIKNRLLTKEREQRFKKRFESQVAQANTKPAPDPAARIAALEAQIERYIDAIGEGGFSPTLKARLAAAETEKAQLLAAPPPRPQPNVVKLVTDAFGRYREMVGSIPAWLSKDPERAQGVLSSLFGVIPVDVKGNARSSLDPSKILGLAQPRDLVGSGGRI